MNNTDNLVSHNVYFEGKVQSLGLETEKGKATLGVMKKGVYEFSTSSAEKMIVISGSMNVRLPGNDWVTYTSQQEFDVVAGVSFGVSCDADVAYICYYG
ncbi:pyrimidine/purine nucleoside phosphorylase [Pedobacter caeni]|uniref:Uncharacterized protein n=1 Tax=Pedobacter caeni TaxID=288992 RepID=A0A1M5A6S8_9SPHI|nr:pyrimidine/purine nucleoside phosphorylase [Pedobacter caeni]SHF25837.1 hypothetical protein SAMN04488522_102608 [Pedobacter caeni]